MTAPKDREDAARAAREAEVAKLDEAPALTDEQIVEMYRNPDVFGWGCEHEGGWHSSLDTHADPASFTDDQIIAMHRAALDALGSLCLMHVDYRYPAAPQGVWGGQVASAWQKLTDASQEPDDDADSPRPRFVVTPDTLTALWDEYPHARWYFEVEAEASRVDIEVRA